MLKMSLLFGAGQRSIKTWGVVVWYEKEGGREGLKILRDADTGLDRETREDGENGTEGLKILRDADTGLDRETREDGTEGLKILRDADTGLVRETREDGDRRDAVDTISGNRSRFLMPVPGVPKAAKEVF
jgi:hypothetical protein